MSKKEFIQAIFCAPTGEYDCFPDHPSRLTDEVFSALKEAGINRIYGFGWDIRKETQIKTLALCEKYGMKYLPTLPSFGEYTRARTGEHGEKTFRDMSEAEIAKLDERMLAEVEQYTSYPAFAGVFFGDESGYMEFEAVAHAKRAFDAKYPQYEFHFNFFSYSLNDAAFWGGIGMEQSKEVRDNLPFELTGAMEILFKNRFTYYDVLVEGLLSKVPFEFISQDKYPFEAFWPTQRNTVHVALFELNEFFLLKKRKYNCKFYNYMQAGQWFNADKRRLTYAEAALQMHVTAAYGADGFAYFPGCYPIDYTQAVGAGEGFLAGEQGAAGLIDIRGNKTEFWSWTKKLNGFFKTIEEDILSSNLLGVTTYGKYDNGYDESVIGKLPDNECIFRGDLNTRIPYVEPWLKATCSNGVMFSTFVRDGKKRYYAINLSTVYANEIALRLPETGYTVYSTNGREKIKNEFNDTLDAGCGVYIVKE